MLVNCQKQKNWLDKLLCYLLSKDMFKNYLEHSVSSDSMSFHTKDFIFPNQMGGGQNQISTNSPVGRPIHQDFVTLDTQFGGEPAPHSPSHFSSQSESHSISSINTSTLNIPRNNWSETSGSEASSYDHTLPDNLGKLECGVSSDSGVSGFTSGLTSSLQSVSDSTQQLAKTSVMSESANTPSEILQTGGFFRSGSAAPYAFCDKMIDSDVHSNVESELSHTSDTAQLENHYKHMPYSFSESESHGSHSLSSSFGMSNTSATSVSMEQPS